MAVVADDVADDVGGRRVLPVQGQVGPDRVDDAAAPAHGAVQTPGGGFAQQLFAVDVIAVYAKPADQRELGRDLQPVLGEHRHAVGAGPVLRERAGHVQELPGLGGHQVDHAGAAVGAVVGVLEADAGVVEAGAERVRPAEQGTVDDRVGPASVLLLIVEDLEIELAEHRPRRGVDQVVLQVAPVAVRLQVLGAGANADALRRLPLEPRRGPAVLVPDPAVAHVVVGRGRVSRRISARREGRQSSRRTAAADVRCCRRMPPRARRIWPSG